MDVRKQAVQTRVGRHCGLVRQDDEEDRESVADVEEVKTSVVSQCAINARNVLINFHQDEPSS